MGIADEVSVFHLLSSDEMCYGIGIIFESEEGVGHSCKGVGDCLEGVSRLGLEPL